MLMALALSFVCQHLELAPQVVELGQEVEVRAVDSQGGPIPGLPVDVVLPDGDLPALGVTGSSGVVQLETHQEGLHELRAEMPDGGPLLVTPFRVVSRPRRWLFALVCVPLGLVLLWRNLKTVRRQLGSEQVKGPGSARPGPSPPAP